MVSQGILGTLFGTALGAILTFCTTNFNQWWQIRKQRRIATMQVVSNLRRWMREMAWRFDQTKLSVDSGGHAGSPHTEIPDFHFETSLEQISILRHTTATKLFNLIHEKDNANIEVKWRIEFGVSDFEADEVLDFFRGQSAALYLDAQRNYTIICRNKWAGRRNRILSATR